MNGVMHFGTMFHKGMEAWWGAHVTDEEQLELALIAMRSSAHPDTDPDDLILCEELLYAYHVRWHSEDRYETLAVEQEFRRPLVNPVTGNPSKHYVLGGKVDALVRERSTGHEFLVEHKTTTQDISDGSDYWKKLRMDGQLGMYFTAYPQAVACLYDVAKRPLLRRLVANTRRLQPETDDEFRLRIRATIADKPDYYFRRAEVVRREDELKEFAMDTWMQAWTMRESERHGLAPRNPDACIQYNRPCDYFDVCTGCASVDDERLYAIRPQNPELAQEAP